MLVIRLNRLEVVALVARLLWPRVLEPKVHVRVGVIGRVRVVGTWAASLRRALNILVVADTFALPPCIRLEIQIILIAESVGISWAEIRDHGVVDVFTLAHVQRRRSTLSHTVTLHVSAHALIHLVPRLDVELGEVALVSRFHPAVVLGILLHIFSPALR